MMLRRFILLLFLILSIVFLSGKIQKEPLKPTETIYVEIRGCIRKPGIYEMKLGSDLNGLFQIAELSDNADISAFLLNSKLYNDQLTSYLRQKEKRKFPLIRQIFRNCAHYPESDQKRHRRSSIIESDPGQSLQYQRSDRYGIVLSILQS